MTPFSGFDFLTDSFLVVVFVFSTLPELFRFLGGAAFSILGGAERDELVRRLIRHFTYEIITKVKTLFLSLWLGWFELVWLAPTMSYQNGLGAT